MPVKSSMSQALMTDKDVWTRGIVNSRFQIELAGFKPREQTSPVRNPVRQLLLLVLTALPAFGQISNVDDVATILAQALTRANQIVSSGAATNANPVVAVADREGFVLGVRSLYTNANAFDVLDAITKAGTAAFLSSDQNAFSSRTAGFHVRTAFPTWARALRAAPLGGAKFSTL